jgi:hypothetical protein
VVLFEWCCVLADLEGEWEVRVGLGLHRSHLRVVASTALVAGLDAV